MTSTFISSVYLHTPCLVLFICQNIESDGFGSDIFLMVSFTLKSTQVNEQLHKELSLRFDVERKCTHVSHGHNSSRQGFHYHH
jgi:hypothetical protein